MLIMVMQTLRYCAAMKMSESGLDVYHSMER